MQCVDNYVNKCMNSTQLKVIENDLYGAKKFFKELCKDKFFQRGYKLILIK